jgi:trehalose 6-phosphate phosphatase
MRLLNSDFSLQDFKGSALLMLDYDGTLAPFHPDPNQALPYPGVMEKIQQIMLKGETKVILISGREIKSLIPCLTLDPLPELWGAHGGERLTEKGVYTQASLSPLQKKGLLTAQTLLYPKVVRNESKPFSIALHWRGETVQDQKNLEIAIRKLWQKVTAEHDLEIHAFDGGLELRAKGITKGTAVTTLLQEFPDKTLAYFGDDATDEEAFKAIGKRGLKVLVRREERPTEADLQLVPPKELLEFLNSWLK